MNSRSSTEMMILQKKISFCLNHSIHKIFINRHTHATEKKERFHSLKLFFEVEIEAAEEEEGKLRMLFSIHNS